MNQVQAVEASRPFESLGVGQDLADERLNRVSLMTDVKEKIREFVVEHFLFGDDNGLADDASLLELGVVDSTGVLELVTHIETTFGFKVADEELIPGNLDTIQSLSDFVSRKIPKA